MYGRKLDLKSKTKISPEDLINVAIARADVHAEITSSSLQPATEESRRRNNPRIEPGKRKLRKWRVVAWQQQRELDRL